MALTPQDVSRIAHLARLELGAAEQASMLTQLNGFFSIVEQMSAVETGGVEPLYTPLSAVQEVSLRLRDDVVTEPRTRNEDWDWSSDEVQDDWPAMALNRRFLNQRSAPVSPCARRVSAARDCVSANSASLHNTAPSCS